MPNATLTYTLPEEAREFELAMGGQRLACAWWELRQRLRQKFKYEDKESFNQDELYELLGELEDEYELHTLLDG